MGTAYIGSENHCDTTIIIENLLSYRAASGGKFFVFQQGSAPSHPAKDTVALLDQEMPDFIPPAPWPPNSSDLNQVDYSVWSVLQ